MQLGAGDGPTLDHLALFSGSRHGGANLEGSMRHSIRPRMTFGLNDATALFDKLIFDIERMRNPKNLREPRYAAFDCASDSWHLAEWVICAALDADHLRLTGQKRGSKKGTVTFGFIQTNRERLPYLSFCHQIANTGKHLKLDMSTDPDLSTKGSWRIVPPFEAVVEINTTERRYPALEFFTTMAGDWRRFLIEEGYEFPPECEEG